jgi:gliding motility-associated-like protein
VLDHADTATPAASPLTTTTYTVTGYDTLGCTAKATVTVWVESTAFVPTLFSPNDDGSNDRLKVYGLAPPARFMFRVFNRQGSLVFKTNSIDEIVQTGWDGTTNGVRQPGGVYYWEVDGTSTTGSILLLNGKKSGFVVLIR